MDAYAVNEKDWKLFRQKLPGWQEAYMDRLNREYVALLTGEGKTSDKFWELEKTYQKRQTKRGRRCGDAAIDDV